MFGKQWIAVSLAGLLLLTNSAIGFADRAPAGGQASVPVVKQTPQELQQLVAPIALYPDELVAEVLAAASYPAEIVEADRWLQDHRGLQGQALADEVNKQPWDTSVKALTEFPSVLANMDQNLFWTSSLGDACMSDQQDVMNAVQTMRQRAQHSGDLESTSQQKVSTQGNTIVIEPAAPEVVYVPVYDPWIVYGAPVGAWPGWYWYPGLYVRTPGISFGFGFDVGFFGGFGWGWNHWGLDWAHRRVMVDHRMYISHRITNIGRTHAYHSNSFSRGHAALGRASRTVAPHARVPARSSGAFRSFNHGSVSRGFQGGGGRR